MHNKRAPKLALIKANYDKCLPFAPPRPLLDVAGIYCAATYLNLELRCTQARCTCHCLSTCVHK